ncbi:MAG: hypothetical protein ABSB49_18755 [Polyangia bacterium]|jgi:hypothetical protein
MVRKATIHKQMALAVMLPSYFGLGVIFAQSNPGSAPVSEMSFTRSVDLDLTAAWAYKQTLGLDSDSAKLAYSPMITYSFLLDEHNALGIVLLKFSHFPLAANPVYNFAYGFQFKHYWNRKWADLGAVVPWISYGILLNQALVANEAGRAIGHNTRMGLGCDIVLAPSHRLVLQLGWDLVDYPSLGSSVSNSLESVSMGLGYRLLF